MLLVCICVYIVIQTWRVHRIFNNELLQSVQISDMDLFVRILPVFVYDNGVLAAWRVLQPFDVRCLMLFTCVVRVGICLRDRDSTHSTCRFKAI